MVNLFFYFDQTPLDSFSLHLAYSFDGIIVFVLLTICTCGYMRRVPKLREWFFSEKKGFAGIFYKGFFPYRSIKLNDYLGFYF